MDTRNWLKERLGGHYSRNGVSPPPDFKKREFGFGNEKKIDSRHYSFAEEKELRKYFVENAPLYASYSVAYYEFPDARPMPKKSFLGADLVFEFDTECSHSSLACFRCMSDTKQQTFRLIDDFLKADFGFSQKQIQVAFSGNRGFHVHVRDESIRQVNQEARREIIDYLQGKGIPLDSITDFMKGATPDSGGWRGKLARALNTRLDDADLFKASPSLALALKKRPQEIREALSRGSYDVVRGADNVWKRLVSDLVPRMGNDIDQSVTFDLSRLIRMPSTIHGTTGLLCCYVNDLEKFEPFKHAVALSSAPFRVKMLRDEASITMKDQSFGPFESGADYELPEFAAVFLVAKGAATPL
ncbi:DNA primase catalytic subunit PriS [Candidatus Micrarchaeota archaeon]|nr:DNA primase catalytic subunit PriS [Candidatus Micrarchaeota archaeon]